MKEMLGFAASRTFQCSLPWRHPARAVLSTLDNLRASISELTCGSKAVQQLDEYGTPRQEMQGHILLSGHHHRLMHAAPCLCHRARTDCRSQRPSMLAMMMLLVSAASFRFGFLDSAISRIAITAFPFAQNTDPDQSSPLILYILWKPLVPGPRFFGTHPFSPLFLTPRTPVPTPNDYRLQNPTDYFMRCPPSQSF